MENRQEWDADLLAPLNPRKTSKPSRAQMETEGADFMNFMGAMTS